MQYVAAGFNRNGYSYFVGSAKRPEYALLNARTKSSKNGANWSTVRITRVCDADETETLLSRIDLALYCGNSCKTFFLILLRDSENSENYFWNNEQEILYRTLFD